MSFVSDLKDKLKKKSDFVQSVKDNPEYEVLLVKLKELTEKRDVLYNMIRKVELEIDACLVTIEMKHEKAEIDKELENDKVKSEKWSRQ
jgi:hypothetical protein